MHTHSYAKLFTLVTIDPYMTPGIGEHALNDTYSPFLDTEAPQGPPQDLSRHPIKGFLNVNIGKVEQFAGGDVLLQLVNNEVGIFDTATRHKAELLLIDVHHLSNVED